MTKQAKFDINFDGEWPRWNGPIEADWLLGQFEWTGLIPLLHQTVANPEASHSWPRYSEESVLKEACSYWTAAAYLCVVLLGWEDLGLGLRRLLKNGIPPRPSPHLDLLLQVWNDRDQLGLLGLWAWEQSPQFGIQGTAWAQRDSKIFLGDEWHEHFLRQFPEHGKTFDFNPYYGGQDPLHLDIHVAAAFYGFGNFTPLFVQSRPDQRRAALVLDHMQGSMGALSRTTQTLKDVAPRSWHVDVIVKPVGWLGTFRQSRITGRWFTGTHTVHMMGSRSK